MPPRPARLPPLNDPALRELLQAGELAMAPGLDAGEFSERVAPVYDAAVDALAVHGNDPAPVPQLLWMIREASRRILWRRLAADSPESARIREAIRILGELVNRRMN